MKKIILQVLCGLLLLQHIVYARPIHNTGYFWEILSVILLIAIVLGFFIGSAFALITVSLAGLRNSAGEVPQKKAIWIGGVSGSLLLCIIAVYLVVF
ncbi:MAG: hypothetical protein AAFP70_00740 [Calditrichota bacterium]